MTVLTNQEMLFFASEIGQDTRQVDVTPPMSETEAMTAGMLSDQEMLIHIHENNQDVTLHDVWAHNLDDEFAKLRELVYDYPYVAMDTEFPGVVMNPEGNFTSKADFNYKQVQCNVNKLKLIQVGLALVNSEGKLPPDNDIWQFNFEFSLYHDEFNPESIEVLKAAGIDFERHRYEGIHMEDFGEQLTTSGLICDPAITWITFHSGYDFGYLIKSIMNSLLPENESVFFAYYKDLFPKSYDVKMLIRQPNTINILKGGLQECADQLQVPRIGRRHQAGSDALLTAHLFFKIKDLFFAGNWNEVSEKVQGEMYGLGNTLSVLSMFHSYIVTENASVMHIS